MPRHLVHLERVPREEADAFVVGNELALYVKLPPREAEERAVIEAAEVLARHNVLYFSYGNAPYPVGSPKRAACDSELTEFRALKSAVDALRASRQPKPRYVQHQFEVWDNETNSVVCLHEVVRRLNEADK